MISSLHLASTEADRPRLDAQTSVEETSTPDAAFASIGDTSDMTSACALPPQPERELVSSYAVPPLPTVQRSEQTPAEITMSEPRSVRATFYPPKGVSSCGEDAADGDEQAEPCGPSKPRLDGTPERCRQVWDEFCAKQDPSEFKMDEDLAAISAHLAEDSLPPAARAALEEQLDLAPGSLTNGSVQVVRVRVRRMEAEVVVLDPVQRRMRSAYVRMIGPQELGELAQVLDLLKSWGPAKNRRRVGQEND